MSNEHPTLTSRLLETLQVVGAVAGASAFFAGLALGIGYLANSQQDAMLGIVSTTPSEYSVRTGALFFPRMIRSVASFLRPIQWLLLAGTVVTVAMVIAVRNRLSLLDNLLRFMDIRGSLVFLAYACTIFGALWFFPIYTAPLHASNRSLLTSEYRSGPVKSVPAEVQRVYFALHKAEPSSSEKLFGKYCLSLLGLLYATYVLVRWRKRLAGEITMGVFEETRVGKGSSEYWLGGIKWILQPLLLLVVSAYTVAIPPIYGVVGVPHSVPCISLIIDADTLDAGHLLSDLSGDSKNVIVMRWQHEASNYVLSFIPREKLSGARGEACASENLLSYKVVE